MKWLLLLLVTVNCFAITTPPENTHFPISDPYLASVWGYISSGRQKINTSKYKESQLEIDLSDEYNNKVIVSFNRQKSIAPLAIFIPGSFGPTDRRQPIQMTNFLLEKGYSVVRLPNTLSTEYLDFYPKHQLGDFVSSTNAYVRLVKKLKEKLFFEKIITDDPITIIGVSHGAFISAIIAAKAPSLFSQVMMFSPPIDLLKSTQTIDTTILENSKRITLKTILYDLKKLAPLFLFDKKVEEINQNELAPVAKDLLTFGTFQARLLRSLDIYLERSNQPNPFPNMFLNLASEDYWKWRSQVRFLPLIKKYAPKSWKVMSNPKITDTIYWTDKIASAGIRLTIVSSDNDFINLGHKWSKSRPYLHVMKGGSHYGYRYQEWFKSYVQEQLSL